jgi:hypothetical protein
MIWISSSENVLDVTTPYQVLCYSCESKCCRSCREEKVRSGRCGRLEAKDASVMIPSTLSNDVLVRLRTESSKRLKRQTRPEPRCP